MHDPHAPGWDPDLLNDHPLRRPPDEDEFEAVDLAAPTDATGRRRAPGPLLLPGLGLVEATCRVAWVGDRYTEGTFEDEVEIVQLRAHVGDVIVASAGVTYFDCSSGITNLGFLVDSMPIDMEWASALVREGDWTSQAAIRAWKTDEPIMTELEHIARIDGLWIAPAVRTQEFARWMVDQVRWALALIAPDLEALTVQLVRSACEIHGDEPSAEERQWYDRVFVEVLGAQRGQPISHEFDPDSPFNARCLDPRHPTVYLLPAVVLAGIPAAD